jgi:hypothetical protein
MHARRSPRIALAIVAAVSSVFFYAILFRGTTPIWLYNQGESGLWLDEATRVLRGEVMYCDFFEFVTPGVVYANALALAVMGSSAAAATCIPLLTGVLLAVTLWHISSKLLRGAWVAIPPLLFAAVIYPAYNMGNHKWWTWLFALGAIDLLLQPGGKRLRDCAAGILLGAAILCTQDMGGAIALGVVMAQVPDSRRQRIALTGALCAFLLLVLGWFAARSGMATLVYDLIVFPMTRYRAANGGFSFGVDVAPAQLPRVILLWAISIAGIGGGVLVLFRRRRIALGMDEDIGRWAFIVIPGLAVAIIGNLTRAIEPVQESVRCVLLVVVLARLLQAAADRWPGAGRVIAMVVIAGGVGMGMATVISRQTRAMSSLQTRAGRIISMKELPDVQWLQDHTTAGEAVFLFPDKGGLYFLTRTRNATRYPYLQDMSFSSPSQIQDAIEELRQSAPRAGIFDSSRLYTGSIAGSSLTPLRNDLVTRYQADGPYMLLRAPQEIGAKR